MDMFFLSLKEENKKQVAIVDLLSRFDGFVKLRLTIGCRNWNNYKNPQRAKDNIGGGNLAS